MAFWLDSGGQLLQPGSEMLRVEAKVWYRWSGMVAGRRCLHHSSTWRPRNKARGMRGGLFPTGKTGFGHDLAALYK